MREGTKWDVLTGACLLLLFQLLLSLGGDEAQGAEQRLQVIDGDTFEWRGHRYRIANIDAPEICHAKCDAEKRLGCLAQRRLSQLLAAGDVRVICGDPETGRRIDRHGRRLAKVSVDSQDVADAMIDEDLARPWTGKRQQWCN